MAVTVYGYSDDLIELEGDIREEFDVYMDYSPSGYLAFSNGVLLRVVYDEDGVWRFTVLSDDSNTVTVKQCVVNNPEDAYSDVVIIKDSIKWVTFGTAKVVVKQERNMIGAVSQCETD